MLTEGRCCPYWTHCEATYPTGVNPSDGCAHALQQANNTHLPGMLHVLVGNTTTSVPHMCTVQCTTCLLDTCTWTSFRKEWGKHLPESHLIKSWLKLTHVSRMFVTWAFNHNSHPFICFCEDPQFLRVHMHNVLTQLAWLLKCMYVSFHWGHSNTTEASILVPIRWYLN